MIKVKEQVGKQVCIHFIGRRSIPNNGTKFKTLKKQEKMINK